MLLRSPTQLDDAVSHVLVLDNGKVVAAGPRNQPDVVAALANLIDHPVTPTANDFSLSTSSASSETLVSMKHVNLRYGDVAVLHDISFDIEAGQHTSLSGPNGSGKSTLLSLISGDNSRAYGQHISLFGVRRGSGESIWQLKKNIGLVSNTLHQQFPGRSTLLNAVLSGFHDSVGLYTNDTDTERRVALEWLDRLGLADDAGLRFDRVGFGEQRMVMIARAMVKLPPLLILDEPCSGLDPANQARVLKLINQIASSTPTTLIFVSHEAREAPACIRQKLVLVPGESGSTLLTR